jgi:hypothetical protein
MYNLPGPTNPAGDLIDQVALLNLLLSGFYVSGKATLGATNGLTDETQTFVEDAFQGKVIKIVRGATVYERVVISNTTDTIFFPDLVAPESAIATIGSGEDAEGQIHISCIGDLAGVAGNEVSVALVPGNTNTGERHAAYDAETKILTFTIDTNGLGEQQNIGAGDIMSILTQDGLNSLFSAPIMEGPGFIAGNLPIGDPATPFEGGVDGISVEAGDRYMVILLNAEAT